MRFFFMILALSVSLPVEAKVAKEAKPAKAANKRSLANANKLPSRVLTFVCREEDEAAENVIGVTSMTISLRDNSTGNFSTNLYLRHPQKGYEIKTISGSYTTVPNGYVLRTKWQSSLGEYLMIHVHPAERTAFPSFPQKQLCTVSAELVSP